MSGFRGIYELQPKAFLAGKNVLTGPKLRISLQPDPNRPVRLDVDYKERESYEAGGKLPGEWFTNQHTGKLQSKVLCVC